MSLPSRVYVRLGSPTWREPRELWSSSATRHDEFLCIERELVAFWTSDFHVEINWELPLPREWQGTSVSCRCWSPSISVPLSRSNGSIVWRTNASSVPKRKEDRKKNFALNLLHPLMHPWKHKLLVE